MKILSSYFNSLQPDANALNTLSELRSWIHYSNQNIAVNLDKIPLRKLQSWEYSRKRISHDSGKFFAIEGLSINGFIKDKNVSWNQPIINQPEYGYLGIIVREFNGVLHFLLQAKIEPGNVNKVQLSPTIQATKSNFNRVHKGKTPDYLEYFISPNPDDILVDQLQTEQGARFLKKRNRNVIVYSSKIEAVNEKFMWLTLWQIEQLMRDDNIVNMDTRTVLSCLPFQFTSNHLNSMMALPESVLLEFNHLFSFFSLNTEEYILNWLTRKKLECDILVKPLPIENLDNWVCGDVKIHHENHKFFFSYRC